MKISTRNFGAFAFSLILGFLVAGTTGLSRVIATGSKAQTTSSPWQVAPPAPTISEAERLAELAVRRREVIKRIGEQGILLLFSAEPRVYTNDVDYPYRQENNLYYLTGIKQAGVTLVLIPGAKQTREILFMPKPDPAQETWTGHMLTIEEARARSGIQTVWDETLLNGFLAFLAPRARSVLAQRGPISRVDEQYLKRWREDFQPLTEAIRKEKAELYLLIPPERDSREFRQEQVFAAQLSSVATGLTIKNAMPIFAELRLRKSPWEVRLLQHAVDISAEAFHRVFALARPGMYEYEIQAEFEYIFRKRNADNWGYPCIVGSGVNATTLHYIANQDPLPEDGLLLMDCAAEYDHYSADVTRTIPISGKFTRQQAEIYRIVYEAQQEAIKLVRPGNFVGTRRDPKIASNSIHGRAVEVIKEGLLRLGLITSKESEQYRIWFMHGTSHWIGMNVHDLGDYSTPLAPGMVLTVEPGIYIRPDALEVLPKGPENEKFIAAVRPAFEKYKGIGVRIEDDVLVTEGEPQVMSAAIPSKLEELEAAIARLRQEWQKSGLPVKAREWR
jgi:Xaa-Pro aminopeptidase